MDAILNINKSAGKTSYGVVAMVKRLTGEKRVGHAGTLDPLATGVLPVCLGQATRLTEYLMDTTKTYYAEIELGVTTDTYDRGGKITGRGDASTVTLEQLERALDSFRGMITQEPPIYSAVKYRGTPSYKLARAGIDVIRKSRTAYIYHLELKQWQSPLVSIEVECGKGTYIRSLAHDLGKMLGCGASLRNLVRLKYGIFDINEAVSPEQLEEACSKGYWESLLYPMDSVLSRWVAVIVGEEKTRLIRNGLPVILNEEALMHNDSERCRAYTCDGRLLGVLRIDTEKKQWKPEKVFV
jgi:tRNA pseudouridine55 synthase